MAFLIKVKESQIPVTFSCLQRAWQTWLMLPVQNVDVVNSFYLAIALSYQSRLGSINHAMPVALPLQEPL